jgi:PncC family amidohydrolase
VLGRLVDCGWTVVTAESCTAGALANNLSKGEGAARHFHGGIVAYTKAMKTSALGVPATLLKRETAVSANVATAMAEGALDRSRATVAVAVTGVAGPEPDEDGNPVGLIFCAVARRGGGIRSARLHCRRRGRAKVLEDAQRLALSLLDDTCRAEVTGRRRNLRHRPDIGISSNEAPFMAKKRKYSRAAQSDVKREMHRYKRGQAKSGPGGKGGKVKSRKQAIAIGLSKARKKGKKVPKQRS